MFKFLEGLFNVPLHADSDGALCVVLFEVHSYVLFGCPINFEEVVGTDTGDEMIDILFVSIFDTKVVDHESEGFVPCFMEKEPFGVWGFVDAKFLQVCNEIFMSNFPRFFEAVPCLFDLCIDIVVTDKFLQLVVGNDVGWDKVDGKSDILCIVECQTQIHVGNVPSAISGVRR